MSHASNFTAGHESRCHEIGRARLDYPAGHIEADNRLSWLLGRVEAVWGDRPLYVHLTRDPDAVARSFLDRADRGILLAYRTEILLGAPRRNKTSSLLDFCHDYVETVTANIRHFLRDKPHVAHVALETAEVDFARLWDRIGAAGDKAADCAEWQVRHNATLA